MFPSVMRQIPGSDAHHQLLIAQKKGDIENDLEQQKDLAAADKPGKTLTNEEETFADLLKRTNPETGKPYTPVEALREIANSKDVKEGGTADLMTYKALLGQVNPDTNKPYTSLEALAAVEKAHREAKAEQQPKVTYDQGIPVTVTGPQGTFDINDPALPAGLKPLADAATRAHTKQQSEADRREEKHEKFSAEQQARAFAHSIDMLNRREADKLKAKQIPKGVGDKIIADKNKAMMQARSDLQAGYDKAGNTVDMEEYLTRMQAAQDNFEQRIENETHVPPEHFDVREHMDEHGNFKQEGAQQPVKVSAPAAPTAITAPSRAPVTAAPAAKGLDLHKPEDVEIARGFLTQAKGDKALARQLAHKAGYSF